MAKDSAAAAIERQAHVDGAEQAADDRAGDETEPEAEPIIPYARARDSGSVTSAMYALTTVFVPAHAPARAWNTNSDHGLGETAWASQSTPRQVSDASRTGRRPYRSESRPSSGETTN